MQEVGWLPVNVGCTVEWQREQRGCEGLGCSEAEGECLCEEASCAVTYGHEQTPAAPSCHVPKQKFAARSHHDLSRQRPSHPLSQRRRAVRKPVHFNSPTFFGRGGFPFFVYNLDNRCSHDVFRRKIGHAFQQHYPSALQDVCLVQSLCM